MSSFEPNKRHLREFLIYFFNLMKSAAEAHRLLVETYRKAALNERSCREWFQKFKNSEFDIEDKERSGRPKVYESAQRRGVGRIFGSKFVPNARRTIRWTILWIKHKVPFFHNKCPIFNKKRRKLIYEPDIFVQLRLLDLNIHHHSISTAQLV